jgi:hypothetical protein
MSSSPMPEKVGAGEGPRYRERHVYCPTCNALVELGTDRRGGLVALDVSSGTLHAHQEAVRPRVEWTDPGRFEMSEYTREQVLEILEADMPGDELATVWGVSLERIYTLWRGGSHRLPDYDYQDGSKRRRSRSQLRAMRRKAA